MIKSMALFRGVGAVHPISIQLAGAHLGQVAVPDHVGLLGKRNAKGLAFSSNVEQAELHFLGVLGVECEVDALAVPGRSQGIRPAGPDDWL